MSPTSIMLVNILQDVDNTILNVALPHIQRSLSASPDQIAWALTSYKVPRGELAAVLAADSGYPSTR